MARDTILFDINETVLDLSSLKPKFETAFGDGSVISTWFASLLHTSTVCSLTNVETGFAALAGIALDNIAARRGMTLSEEQRSDILGGFASLQPHDDIIPALSALRSKGYRTVAFSNSSKDLITNQIKNAGLNDYFDRIISIEETGSFKPDAKVYVYGAAKLGRAVEDLRLVATHDWDTHGAMNAGLQAGYIDRTGAAYHPLFRRPDVYGTDMRDIVQQIMQEDGLIKEAV
ncbi:Haloacid dehalogenase, type II [Candidatus Terasakiella magnetica]|uniref:(S)-2-haloacid dehalogenase n=1 Tax=Candidatus Terasakiella magnetica TaxID=1867952 RepID=A0A1C3RH34_9PROT|nr:haloacid dehalogenase type II [Candidatus Terasakiella magnetica]SCA56522.1 Haloacid dehalogenase, type II [Candidatus Terasakiella magnetica]